MMKCFVCTYYIRAGQILKISNDYYEKISEELSGEIRSVQKGNLLTEGDLSSKPD